MSNFIYTIMRWRYLVAFALLLSLGLAAFSARTIRARFQFSDFYTYPGNPSLPLYRQDNEEFGDSGGYVIAMVEAQDVFEPGVLAYIQQLTAALTPEPVFSRIRSLTNVSAIRARGDEVISGALLAELPKTADERAELKRFALHSPLILRRLVSADAKTAAVLAQMRIPATLATIDQQAEAIAAFSRVLAAHPPPSGTFVRVTGAPSVEVQTTHALITDQLILTPAVITLLIVMLYVTFRSPHGVILALAAVTTATLWTAGIFALFGRPVDLIASIIPTSLLVYGVVDPIFVLTRVLQKLDAGRPKPAAIAEAFSELALPCFLTSVTTALGFAAFITAAVPTMRYFGLTVAIGILLAWVTTNTVLPVLLAFTPLPKRGLANSRLAHGIDRVLHGLWATLRGRATAAVIATLLLLGAGAVFASRQNISNAYVGSLPRGSAQTDVRRLEQQLTGVVRLTVYLEGAPDSMKNPEVLRAIERVDRATEKQPLVTYSASLADLVAEVNQAFNAGDPTQREVPRSRSLIGQYVSLVDPADRSELVSDDYARSHIAILIEDRGSKPTAQIAQRLQRDIDAAGFSALGVKASITGIGIVGYPQLDEIVHELLWGFVIAFALIVLLQWVLFRSLRLSLIGVVPNLVPVVACFTATRLLGIDLRIDTTLVLCVSIGGLFNTTIHYSARVLQQVAAGERDPDQILLQAMRAVGPPALFTAVALSAGFAVFLLSSFYGLQAMGLLSMITLLTGFVSDMVVTTVIMRSGFGWKNALRRSGRPAIDIVSNPACAFPSE